MWEQNVGTLGKDDGKQSKSDTTNTPLVVIQNTHYVKCQTSTRQLKSIQRISLR